MLEDGRADDGMMEPTSIMFEPTMTGKKQEILQKLNVDLRVQKMTTVGNIEERLERLLEMIEIELD
jgi:hypothetical protein